MLCFPPSHTEWWEYNHTGCHCMKNLPLHGMGGKLKKLQFHFHVIDNGKMTEWSPVQSVIA